MDRPETQFVWNGEIALAYQTLGAGEDLLFLPGWMSNVELNWEYPAAARFLRGLARSRRLIVTDCRGFGCSERGTPNEVPLLETMMEDVAVVLDGVGSERSAIFATNETGISACLFAATYPERTAALILYETSANWLRTEETPWEWTEEEYEESLARDRHRFWTRSGVAELVWEFDPGMADDQAYVDWWYRYCLLSQAPGAALAAGRRYMRTDIRPILPSIHVPVLVLVRPGGPHDFFVAAARFLVERVPGASLVELPGENSSLVLGDQAATLHAVERFLSEVRREASELERVLATVLFTDIVGSTDTLAAVGNAAWRGVVERHHIAVRALLAAVGGARLTDGEGSRRRLGARVRGSRGARAEGRARCVAPLPRRLTRLFAGDLVFAASASAG